MKRNVQNLARLGALLLLLLPVACTATPQIGTPTPAPPTAVPTITAVPTPGAQRVDHFPTAVRPIGKAADMRTPTPTPTPRPLSTTDKVWVFTCE